ncbi:MAG: peptidase domain-containing ABC transporter [Bacteroidales bacterium]|jgi:ATP-binding cassette subfamily B protein
MRFSVNIRQHDISDCGVASLASVATYYGLKVPLAKLRLYSGTNSQGTTIRGIIDAAEKIGMCAKGFKGKTSSLYKVLKPVILLLKKEIGLMHFVVLYKISKQYFYLMDPAEGNIVRVNQEEFNKEWTGYLIVVEPDSCFVKGLDGPSSFARLHKIILRDISEYLKILAASLVYIVISLSTSVFLKYIIDDILPHKDNRMLFLIAIGMAGLIVISLIISVYKSRILLRLSLNTNRKLILAYLRHVFRLPQNFFDNRKTGELTSRVDDAFRIGTLLSELTVNITISILTLVFSFILLFTMFWKLALVVVAFIPAYLILYCTYDRFNRRMQRKIMEEASQFESSMIESLRSVRSIKQFGLESVIVCRIKERLFRLNDSLYNAGKIGIMVSGTGESISRILSLAVLWIGGSFVLSSSLSTGELFSFFTITALFSSPLSSLACLNVSVREGITAAERLFEIMDLDIEKSFEGVIISPESRASLKIENLSFSYQGREPLFEGFNMEMKSGEITYLMGESGCGKSTIASLILRIQKPVNGVITLDGVNINHFNLELWRQWVTIVPQNLDLLGGTLIDNIAPGESDPDYEYIIELCGELGLLDFIQKLPLGFESPIGESGSSLSRGQQQKIAIARALYRKPKILILDEATSSLDRTSEELIRNAVLKAKNNGTMILMITHNETSINDTDRQIRI